MTKKRKYWLLGGGVALVLLLGGGALVQSDKGVGVQVGKVQKEDLQAKVSANGKIQAVKKADISANTMGQVTRLAVKEGDFVKQGQFLLEIDPSRSKASVEGVTASMEATTHDLDSAKTRLEHATRDFQRAEMNRKAGIISQAEYDQLKTAHVTAEAAAAAAHRRLEQARANVREAKVGLRYTTITAPMDGIVTARRIEQGETAVMGLQSQPGTVLLTISDMSKVEAEMEVDEASIPNVKMGQNAQVRIDAYPNQTFDGEVTEVGGSPILKLTQNEATKFKVKVWIKNPPATIKPGLSAQADIYTGQRDGVLAVPIQALVAREIKRKEGEKVQPGAPREEEGVFIVEGKKARFVAVKTGLMGELKVELLQGPTEGQQVVTGPFKALRDMKDGDPVRIEKSKKKSDSERDTRKAD